MARTLNVAGLELVRRNEGLRLSAYQDVAGIWSIGYGHTPASPGQTIDDAEADRLLLNDLNFACAIVSDATNSVHTTDNEFAAMASLAFNIGIGGFRTSSVVRLHRAGNTPAAADAFLLWDKAHIDGVLTEVPGLLRRRREERALYLTAPVPVPAPPHADLQPGDVGNDVSELQQRLIAAGYKPGAVSGIFDQSTVDATITFRKARGIPLVDAKVWTELAK